MKKLIFLFFLNLCYPNLWAQEVLKLEGAFQGVNLYMQNPAVNDTCFCTDSIVVNGKNPNWNLAASAIEIKLKDLYLNLNDKVVIDIYHKKNCAPKILNTNACPKYSFPFYNLHLSKEGILSWEATAVDKNAVYEIEHFRWNRWIKVGSVKSKGISKKYSYSFEVKYHSSENKFRVKQVNNSGKNYTSDAIIILADLEENKIIYTRSKTRITLTYESDYEIYSDKGDLLLSGRGSTIDINELIRGVYYINYDNKTDTFVKR